MPQSWARSAVVGAALALLVVALGGPGPRPWRTDPTADAGRGTVVRVVDGDTVVVHLSTGEETVRLLGVDTPETVKPDSPVECFGPEASARTKHLLPPGTGVLLRRDAEPRDRFGRLLAYLWRADDGRSVNLDLVRGGYASVLVIPPNGALAGALRSAQTDARASHRGQWGRCDGDEHGRDGGGR